MRDNNDVKINGASFLILRMRNTIFAEYVFKDGTFTLTQGTQFHVNKFHLFQVLHSTTDPFLGNETMIN